MVKKVTVPEEPVAPEPEKTPLEILTGILDQAIKAPGEILDWLDQATVRQQDEYIRGVAEETGETIDRTEAMIRQSQEKGWMIGLGIMSAGGLAKAGLTAAAAKKASTLAINKSAAEIIRVAAENPKTLAGLYRTLPELARKLLFVNLGKTATGRTAVVSLQKALGKNPALATKIINYGLAKGAIASLMGATGTLMFTGFIQEEGIQQFNMAMFNLVQSKDWVEADKAFPVFKAGIESITKTYDLLFAIPIFGTLLEAVYKPIVDSARLQVDAFRKTIDAGLATETVPTTITISTNSDPAEVEIIGIEGTFETPLKKSIPPGSYSVEVNKDGFVPASKTGIVKAGQDNPLSFTLKEITPEPSLKKGRLQVSLFDYKTAAAIKGTLFINGIAEKFHLHSYVIDLDEGIYELRVEEPLYKTVEDTVSVELEKTTDLKINLEKIEEPTTTPPTTPAVPVTPQEPTTTSGRLELASEQEASVWIAGTQVLAKTPGIIELPQGFYDITFKSEGYKDLKRSAIIKTGELSRLAVTPIPIEAPAQVVLLPKINVNSEPTGAKILINGEWTQKYTPDSIILLPGQYELSLTKSGFDQWFYALDLVEE